MTFKYKVKFWNPDKPGHGFIMGYRLARAAKLAVMRYNFQYAKDGFGIKAKYLGKDDSSR